MHSSLGHLNVQLFSPALLKWSLESLMTIYPIQAMICFKYQPPIQAELQALNL